MGNPIIWDMEYTLMANTFGNPIILDTFTSDIDLGLSAFGISEVPFYINHIEWQAPDNTTHQAIVRDSYGGIVFDEKCTVAHQSVFKPFGGQIVMGLKIVSGEVGSGKISIKIG